MWRADAERFADKHEGMTILNILPDTNRLLKIGKNRGGRSPACLSPP
jgi:hypothetical protein